MKELPLLRFTSNLFPEIDFENVTVIAIQHAIDITHHMFLELYKKGLKPENTYLLGKCYSTNIDTVEDLRRKGAYVSDSSFAFDSHSSFDEQFTQYVKKFLQECKKQRQARKDKNKIILVDDGGFLIRNVLEEPELLSDTLSATELTSSGYNSLKDCPIPFPVLNIARSKAKLEIEGTMIAELEVRHIERVIEEEKLDSKNILIMGGGAIGKKIYSILVSKKYSAHVFDIDTSVSTTNDLRESLKNADVVIGATGSSPLSMEDIADLEKKVLLISTSSSDREFPSASIRSGVSKNVNPHHSYPYKNTILVNSGFPINFTGERVSLPLEQVQLTDSLILSAIFQASKEKDSKGFVTLAEDIQDQIVEEFLNYYPQYRKNW